jgi:trehalose 6-phosphate phosphatase
MNPPMSPPKLTPDHALFLDIDGTIIDLAATPDAVTIPPGLPETLTHLQQKLGGALAIISGRKLTDIDRLAGKHLACAAEHGAILRHPDGSITRFAQRPAAYDSWLKTLKQYANAMPGILIEEKDISLVVHYRRAPEHEAELGQLVERLIGASDDSVLLLAHCAFELKPRAGNKADALAAFMEKPPFAGRPPIFIGDDVTDEPAIREANERGGHGLHVARDFAGSPAAVRTWLSAI